MTLSSSPRRGAANGVAILALILALAALFFALCSDPFKSGFSFKVPFSSGLSGYDVETPAGMYKSQIEIEVNRDIRAMLELERRFDRKELKEKLDTLKIDSEADFKVDKKDSKDPFTGEYKILFVSYKRDSKDQKEVVAMEKHRDSGLWRSRGAPLMEINEKNKELAKKIQDWQVRDDK